MMDFCTFSQQPQFMAFESENDDHYYRCLKAESMLLICYIHRLMRDFDTVKSKI